MIEFLQQSFQENTIIWLLISSIIGGIIGATTKFVFDVILPVQLQQNRKTRAIVAKYRDPILRSGLDLQSRFYNILKQNFLQIYFNKSEEDNEYVVASTLYVIAEFLAWREILRREVQFLEFGNTKSSRQLELLLAEIIEAFSTDAIDLTFRLFRGQQRAIGEIMIVERGDALGCLGFATFNERLERESDFASWFSKLRNDIAFLASQPKEYGKLLPKEQRLVHIHDSLIDLLGFLDPNHIRIPKDRVKISSVKNE